MSLLGRLGSAVGLSLPTVAPALLAGRKILMAGKYLIGVDLGTSGTKAALYRPDGKLIAKAAMEVPIYYPNPGVVEQDNDDFYTSAAQTVHRCVQDSGIDPDQIAAIAFDSQMAGIGTIDEEYKPATRFDSWLDMRCQPYIEMMDREAGDLVTRLTGCSDAQSQTWSAQLCDRLGLDQEKLPEIVEPWRIIGEVKDRAATDFGLSAGTSIAAGAGDTAANALGAGVVQAGMLFDVAGTAAVLAGCTDRFVADEKHRALLSMHSVLPGLWNPLAYIAGGGIALRWFRDQFYNTGRGQPLPPESDLYDAMTSAAVQVPPGCDGLFFSPHLGGRICPADPQMRGAWVGFSFGHTQAHFFRAVLESVAFEYAYYLGILKDLIPGLQLIEARVVGGGARSQVWNQIKADVLDVPYQPLKRS